MLLIIAHLLEKREAFLHLVHAAVLEQALVVAIQAHQKHHTLRCPVLLSLLLLLVVVTSSVRQAPISRTSSKTEWTNKQSGDATTSHETGKRRGKREHEHEHAARNKVTTANGLQPKLSDTSVATWLRRRSYRFVDSFHRTSFVLHSSRKPIKLRRQAGTSHAGKLREQSEEARPEMSQGPDNAKVNNKIRSHGVNTKRRAEQSETTEQVHRSAAANARPGGRGGNTAEQPKS